MYDLEEQEQIDALKAWWKDQRPSGDGGGGRGCCRRSGDRGLAVVQARPDGRRPAQLYAGWRRQSRANDLKQVRETVERS